MRTAIARRITILGPTIVEKDFPLDFVIREAYNKGNLSVIYAYDPEDKNPKWVQLPEDAEDDEDDMTSRPREFLRCNTIIHAPHGCIKSWVYDDGSTGT